MALETESIHLERDGWVADLTVAKSTVTLGWKRQARRNEAIEVAVPSDEDIDLKILRIYLFPDMVSGTTACRIVQHAPVSEGEPVQPDLLVIEGLPTFEQFLDLPEWLEAAWETLIYKLNPHWGNKEAVKDEADPNHPKELPTESLSSSEPS